MTRSAIGRTRLRVLAMILDADGLPPTLRQMAKRLGVGFSVVQQHIAALERMGLVRRGRGARALVPTCRFVPGDRLGEA